MRTHLRFHLSRSARKLRNTRGVLDAIEPRFAGDCVVPRALRYRARGRRSSGTRELHCGATRCSSGASVGSSVGGCCGGGGVRVGQCRRRDAVLLNDGALDCEEGTPELRNGRSALLCFGAHAAGRGEHHRGALRDHLATVARDHAARDGAP